jgi:hypothetical protein
MADNKLINRLRLMLDHAKRAMEQDEPDLKIVEKLLADALALAINIREPPDPYADQTLRPGLQRSSEHDVTNYEGQPDV